ncbi:uncharacterized protein [Callorhinus ursinus]|uniref:uncharacterized protein isoform X3 n=1 Tax=Callorhinus ursinus TaxID=34884 RepID=UPI003CD03D95
MWAPVQRAGAPPPEREKRGFVTGWRAKQGVPDTVTGATAGQCGGSCGSWVPVTRRRGWGGQAKDGLSSKSILHQDCANRGPQPLQLLSRPHPASRLETPCQVTASVCKPALIPHGNAIWRGSEGLSGSSVSLRRHLTPPSPRPGTCAAHRLAPGHVAPAPQKSPHVGVKESEESREMTGFYWLLTPRPVRGGGEEGQRLSRLPAPLHTSPPRSCWWPRPPAATPPPFRPPAFWKPRVPLSPTALCCVPGQGRLTTPDGLDSCWDTSGHAWKFINLGLLRKSSSGFICKENPSYYPGRRILGGTSHIEMSHCSSFEERKAARSFKIKV